MNWKQIARHMSPPRDLDAAQFGSPLRLQMSALLLLLQSGPDRVATPDARSPAEPLEQQVLDHEQRYWEQTAADHALTLHPATLSYAVTTASLLGASNETEALTTLSRVPGRAGPTRTGGSLSRDGYVTSTLQPTAGTGARYA